MEEYFADQIAKAFAENFEGKFAKIWERAGVNTTQSRAVSVNQLKHDVAETLQNVFGLMEISTDIDFSKLTELKHLDLVETEPYTLAMHLNTNEYNTLLSIILGLDPV